MLCAKHNQEIPDGADKEQVGDVWLCRQAIWDMQTVSNLMTDKDLQEQYTNQVVINAKADSLEQFIATNPTKQQILDFVKLYNQ